MRRYWPALIGALLLFAVDARAKVLVVVDRPNISIISDPPGATQVIARELAHSRQILDRLGVTYKIAPANIVKTEYARTGVMVWPNGQSETFDAVWVVNAAPRIGTSIPAGFLRTDSLTILTVLSGQRLPLLVPILYTGTNYLMDFTTNGIWADGASGSRPCSLGVSSNLGTVTSNGAGAQVSGGYFQAGFSDQRVIAGSYKCGWLRNSTAPAGGIRVLVRGPYVSGVGRYAELAPNKYPTIGDSMSTSDTDSLIMWEKTNSHVPGSKPLIACWYTGRNVCADSVDSGLPLACEGEWATIAMALARLDSITGGRVFEDKTKLPLKLGVVIDGGFSRGNRRNYRALFEPDSASLKNSIDSLRSISVPFVVSADVESIAARPNEKGWWLRGGAVRFAPMTRMGIDSSAANGTASFNQPVDIWGRFRQRGRFYGPGTAADSSLYALLRGARWKLDSIFPVHRSTCIVPQDGDWSPKLAASGTSDSTITAAALAGFSTIIINSQTPSTSFRSIGYPPAKQRRYQVPSNGASVKLLGYTGYGIAGGHSMYDVRSDSSDQVADYIDHVSYGLSRAWFGLFFDQANDRDFTIYTNVTTPFNGVASDQDWEDVNKPLADKIYWYKRGNILRFCPNDFAGDPANPPRVAWHIVKSIDNARKIVNRMANRTVIDWAFPEDIAP